MYKTKSSRPQPRTLLDAAASLYRCYLYYSVLTCTRYDQTRGGLMREREYPMTQTMKASEARRQFSQLLNQVARKETRVVVEKSGVPVAAIVSADDLATLQRFEADRNQRFAALDRIGEAFKDVPAEELEAEVSKALAAVRAENRTQAIAQR